MAAVTLQTPVASSAYTTNATTHSLSVTVASGTNTVLAVCVQLEDTASVISGVTYNALALTKLDSQAGVSFSRSEIWYRVAPTVTTANVIVTSVSEDRLVIGALVADGVDQSVPLRTAVKSTGTGATSVTNTVASVGVDDLVFDSLSLDGTGHLTAVGGGQTNRWNLEPVAGSTTGVTDTQPGTVDGVMSHTWTTATEFSHVASAFIAAAAAAAVLRPSFSPIPFQAQGRNL